MLGRPIQTTCSGLRATGKVRKTQRIVDVIKFEDFSWMFGGWLLYPLKDEMIEIIGNVFENPELLEND